MKKKLFSAMGLMSGTSMDGVDLSIIKSDGHNEISFIFDEYFEYDSGLYKQLVTTRDMVLNASDLVKYSKELKFLFIVSEVKLVEKLKDDEGVYFSELLPGVKIFTERHRGKKCERCWHYFYVETSGINSLNCERCQSHLQIAGG